MTVSLEPFLHLAAILLALGIYGLVTRREAHSAIVSLQIITHAIVIALVALGRGWDRAAASNAALANSGGASAGFADAFGVLIVMLLGIQAVIGLSLVLHQHVPPDLPGRSPRPSGAEVER